MLPTSLKDKYFMCFLAQIYILSKGFKHLFPFRIKMELGFRVHLKENLVLSVEVYILTLCL